MGRAHPRGGGAGSFSASPSANPVGRRRRLVQLITHRIRTTALGVAIALVGSLAIAGSSFAGTGGIGPGGGGDGGGDTTSSGGGGDCNKDAKLVKGGRAVAPDCAPGAVQRAIKFANSIRKKPYCWGGGHGSWEDNCYDCSGAVSYALHGARILDSPLDSSGLARWGSDGRGKWITVYANRGHAYAKIAGLRWDTSMVPGDGPGWSTEMRSGRDFAKRHKRY